MEGDFRVMIVVKESNHKKVVDFLGICNCVEDLKSERIMPDKQAKVMEHFTPTRRLQDLLREEWFEKFSADKAIYTIEWREKLVTALMDSEHGEKIAQDWTDSKKRKQIRFKLVGALVNMKVLKTNFNALAQRVCAKGDKQATLAKYMGYGKLEPYYLWLEDWVSENDSPIKNG